MTTTDATGERADRDRVGRRGRGQRAVAARQQHAEHRAASLRRVEVDAVAEQRGEADDDRQAEAETALVRVDGSLAAVELVEDARALLRCDAGTGVPDLQGDRPAASPAADDDAARRGVAQRVGDQVAQDALDQHRVGAQVHARRHDREREAAFERHRSEVVRDAVEQLVRGQVGDLGDHRPGVEPRDVEERREVGLEGVHRARDALHERALVRSVRVLGESGGEQADGVQRLPQVVARRGEEAALGDVGGLGGILGGTRLRELGNQRGALLGDRRLESGVDALGVVQRAHEAVDENPADEHEEREGGVGHEPHRPHTRRAGRGEPVVHRERDGDDAGEQQQPAVRARGCPGRTARRRRAPTRPARCRRAGSRRMTGPARPRARAAYSTGTTSSA